MDDEQRAAPTWDGPLDATGRPHGDGTMTYPAPAAEDSSEAGDEPKQGDSYKGRMEHGKRQGRGTYTWEASGTVYSGEYAANRRHGQGSMLFPDRGSYEGGFEDDLLEGQGTYKYPNGDIFSGGFKAGKKHGAGQMFFKAHGCVFIGVWASGQFVEGKWVHRDGTTFTGSFEASVPSEGTMFFSRTGLVQEVRYSAARGWRPRPVTGAVAFVGGAGGIPAA